MDDIVSVEHLVKKYTPAAGVEDINFTLRPGRVFAYLGHNGAGKTTTVRTVLGLLKADSGRISYDGRVYNTSSSEYDRVRLNYGVCMDTPGFYRNMPAIKNLELFAGLYGRTGKEFRSMAELLLKKLGLFEVRNDAVKTYSKGMAQKLSLARALIHNPKVLFLDEPMSGLDPAARIVMRETLKELAVQTRLAIFLTSHDLNEVEQVADDIVILEKGRVILSGELSALKSSFMKSFIYELVLPPAIPAGKADEIAAALGASVWEVKGETLHIELPDELALETAAEACSGRGVKMMGFHRIQANLEKIYFDSINRNENKN